MKNFHADGNVFPYRCRDTVRSGDVIVMGRTVGVAKTDGIQDELIAVQVEGVVSLPRLGNNFDQGQTVHVDASGEVFEPEEEQQSFIAGVAYDDTSNTGDFVQVKLNR